VNVREEEGQRLWEASGRPIVPSIEIDGRAMPILHIAQIASLLDLPSDAIPEMPRLAFDTVNILSSWAELIDSMDFELLCKPTRSRQRSIRNLTVNTFHPFELLPEAWQGGNFDWRPEDDGPREAALLDAPAIRAYARERLNSWQMFLLDVEQELETADDREVWSPRGTVPFSTVLTSQRWHAAFHHRQLTHFLREEEHPLVDGFDVEVIHDIDLPENVY
jgi:hypothetical protein